MLPQRGQARIWPIADSSRTESRARQVTQVTLNRSTRVYSRAILARALTCSVDCFDRLGARPRWPGYIEQV